uniref:Uncharacterized protein n=1 Tax=Kalanchoe fedtschenkoi TaxID=63787 RepID=A0A7N0UZ27_KALFE
MSGTSGHIYESPRLSHIVSALFYLPSLLKQKTLISHKTTSQYRFNWLLRPAVAQSVTVRTPANVAWMTEREQPVVEKGSAAAVGGGGSGRKPLGFLGGDRSGRILR